MVNYFRSKHSKKMVKLNKASIRKSYYLDLCLHIKTRLFRHMTFTCINPHALQFIWKLYDNNLNSVSTACDVCQHNKIIATLTMYVAGTACSSRTTADLKFKLQKTTPTECQSWLNTFIQFSLKILFSIARGIYHKIEKHLDISQNYLNLCYTDTAM